MKATRIVATLFVATSIGVGACVAAGLEACTQTNSCTPEEHGLASTTRLRPRELPGRAATPGACARPRTEVIASEEELRSLYEELGSMSSSDGSAPDGGSPEYPSVDFSREHVIVREGAGNEGISWVVASGETGVLGLLSCIGTAISSCAVNVIAVPASITRAESRTCDPVRCGVPPPR